MRILTLMSFLLLLAVGSLAAQITLEIDTVYASVVPGDSEVVAHNEFTNVLPVIKTFRWIRTDIAIPDEWESFVCDVNTCWTPAVDSMEVDLGPGASSLLDVHVDINDQPNGNALIEVLIKDTTDEDNAVTAVFYFEGVSSNDNKFIRTDFKVYPNPSSGIFAIEENDFNIKYVEIFSTTGLLVKSLNLKDGIIALNDLKSGTYFIQLIGDRSERSIAKLITKL